MICIIDYGVGNLFSLKSSLAHLGLEAKVSADAADIRAADRLILPGVGAFGDAMAKLVATGRGAVGGDVAAPCTGHQGRSGAEAPPRHLPRDAAAV